MTKSIHFYEKLVLKLIVASLPHYARFECPDGNSTFSIHQTENLPKGDGIYVYFECDNLDDYVNELMKKGIVFDPQPTDQKMVMARNEIKGC